MARLCIHLLGPFHVTLAGKPVTGFESNKVRALLSFLALEAGRPHTRDALIGLLWPDQPERAARRNLSQALFNLRQAIHDDVASCFLHITRETIQFNAESDHWLDARAFAEHLTVVQAHLHSCPAACEPCIQHLDQAVELYAGEFLAGLFVGDSATFSEWATLLRERHHRQVLDALYHLTEHHERRRDYARALHCARRQVELEPWREEAHQQTMRLLVRSGQRSAALQQYELCRRSLAGELGIEPSPETQRLYRRIRSAFTCRMHNLPPQVTPFVGREAELRELACRLADPACRLLTLVGPGGIGKTRLAVQAAHENHSSFLHGVCFVSLAPLPSAELLASTLADALGLYPDSQTDPKTQVIEALREKELLLALDNFEHLIEVGAPWLADILQAAPEVTLLVTSRERLNLHAETVFEVGGLEFPSENESERPAACSAMDLFLQSADRAQVGFRPANGGMADVARICRLVEGMPLGIELAAAWVRVLTCCEIANQIERGLAFLSASARDVPPRHRSMQAAFDHSWARLRTEERNAFQRLAVFRGGFDREAASQVAGTSLATLAALVDKSFLKEMAGRYSLHELMRQYAAEKLAQDPQEAHQAHDDHCRCYADLVSGLFERFEAGQQRAALDAIAAELDNVRAAWQWAIDQGQYERLAQMMQGLYVYCAIRSVREGDLFLGKAVTALEAVVASQPEAEEEVHCLVGKLLWRWGHFVRIIHPTDEKTEALFRRSVALLRVCGNAPQLARAELARALDGLGKFLDAAGRYAEARQVLEESLEIGHQLQDRERVARSLASLGVVVKSVEEMRWAKQLIQEDLAIQRKLGDLMGMAYSLSALSGVAYYLGDQTEAKRLCLDVKAVHEELGDLGSATVAISNAGHVCIELGEYEAAARYLQEALQKSVALQQGRFTMNILHGLAELASKVGRCTLAYELATFVCCTPLTYPGMVEDAQRLRAELETKLPPEVTAAAEARAKTWTLDDVVAEALAVEWLDAGLVQG